MALTLTVGDIRPADLDRFHEQVQRGEPDECWPWTGPVDHNGFDRVDVELDGRRQRLGPRRIAYLLEYGTLPSGHLAPSCGSRPCRSGRHWRPRAEPGAPAVPEAQPQPPRIGAHPWLDVVDAQDRYPVRGRRALISVAIRAVHGLAAQANWDQVMPVVCEDRRTAAELRDLHLERYLALGGDRQDVA